MSLEEFDTPFDEYFVQAAARHEQSAEVRIAAARRVVREHSRAQPWRAPAQPLLGPGTSQARPRQRGRPDRRGALAAGLALALLAAALLARPQGFGLLAGPAARAHIPAVAAPPRPADAARTRLLAAPNAPEGRGGWLPLVTDPATGEFLRFDPCRPVHYVIRAGLEPPGAARVLDAAIQEVSRDTGLVFVSDGPTSEPPTERRAAIETSRYGNRWAPVLIAWSNPGESAGLAGDVDGYAGPQVGFDGRQHLISGQVVLDAAQLTTSTGTVSPAAYPTALHELAHLVGLGHVGDPQELMYPQLTSQQNYGPGDRRGLAQAGQGPCN